MQVNSHMWFLHYRTDGFTSAGFSGFAMLPHRNIYCHSKSSVATTLDFLYKTFSSISFSLVVPHGVWPQCVTDVLLCVTVLLQDTLDFLYRTFSSTSFSLVVPHRVWPQSATSKFFHLLIVKDNLFCS